jgi:hypothetical protein
MSLYSYPYSYLESIFSETINHDELYTYAKFHVDQPLRSKVIGDF